MTFELKCFPRNSPDDCKYRYINYIQIKYENNETTQKYQFEFEIGERDNERYIISRYTKYRYTFEDLINGEWIDICDTFPDGHFKFSINNNKFNIVTAGYYYNVSSYSTISFNIDDEMKDNIINEFLKCFKF